MSVLFDKHNAVRFLHERCKELSYCRSCTMVSAVKDKLPTKRRRTDIAAADDNNVRLIGLEAVCTGLRQERISNSSVSFQGQVHELQHLSSQNRCLKPKRSSRELTEGSGKVRSQAAALQTLDE